jgi:hypothetical protein
VDCGVGREVEDRAKADAVRATGIKAASRVIGTLRLSVIVLQN